MARNSAPPPRPPPRRKRRPRPRRWRSCLPVARRPAPAGLTAPNAAEPPMTAVPVPVPTAAASPTVTLSIPAPTIAPTAGTLSVTWPRFHASSRGPTPAPLTAACPSRTCPPSRGQLPRRCRRRLPRRRRPPTPAHDGYPDPDPGPDRHACDAEHCPAARRHAGIPCGHARPGCRLPPAAPAAAGDRAAGGSRDRTQHGPGARHHPCAGPTATTLADVTGGVRHGRAAINCGTARR